MNRVIILFMFAALLSTGCSERDRMAISGEGLVTSGELLGVGIGTTEQQATEAMVMQGLARAGVERGGTCLSPKGFRADYTIQFVDFSWRRGTVCLGVTRGRVTQIGWLYNIFSP